MKKQLLLLLFLAISISGFAQFPFNGFNYQGVARDANGKGFDTKNIGVKFELFNHVTGISVYNETLNTTTNKFGLFTHVLGGQAQLQFAGLPWASGIDLEVSVDTAGGVSYVAIGPKTQFEGVPYSLFSYASFLDWSRSGNAAGANDFLGTTNLFPLIFKTNSNEAMRVDINQNVGIGNNPVSKLDVNGDIHATDSIMSNSKISSGTYVNTVNGYKYKNSAITGKYLRGNGSYFVPDSIKLADLPAAIASPPWTKSGNNIFPTVLNNKVGINNNLPVEQLDVIGGANTTLGYKYNSLATAGKYMRGNGSYIVLDSIKLTDLPAGVASIPWTKSGTNVFPTAINDNIGIGVNAPISPLQVYSASNNDTILARFIGTNSFGAAIQIANALNTTTAIIFKSASTQASIGYNPIGPNRLFIENIKIGGNIHITTNDRLRIKTDTVSINGTNTSQAFFGVGVNNPSAGIHLLSDNGALFQGQHALGAAKNLGAGTRMMWYSKKSAFRAGAVTGTQWDDVNIGNYSFAAGKDNTARGDSSIAMGQGSVANGMSSVAIGYTNTLASGAYSFALGYFARAAGNGSVAIGANVNANSANSMAIGNGATTVSSNAVAFGNNVLASGVQSFVFGAGTNNGPLTNPINNSIGFGINSDIPTLFIGTSAGLGTTGKVGIGTSTPDQQLTISHATEPIVRLDRIGAGFDWEVHAGSNGFQIRGGANGFGNVLTDFITLDGFGKFGIGTTTPAYKLDVVGGDVQVDVDAKIGSRLASPGSNGYIIPYDANGRTLIWNTYTASQGILFGTNNVERMRINLSGNVGIGTASPSTRLDIVGGNVKIDAANDYRFRTAKAKTMSIPCVAFVESDPNGDIFDVVSSATQLWVWAKSLAINAGQTVYMSAPIYLPDSATITDFEVTFGDNNSTYGNTAELYRATGGGTTTLMATVSTSAAFNGGQSVQTTNSIQNPLVETNVYKYWIRYSATTYSNAANLTAVYGAKIKYTVTKVD